MVFTVPSAVSFVFRSVFQSFPQFLSHLQFLHPFLFVPRLTFFVFAKKEMHTVTFIHGQLQYVHIRPPILEQATFAITALCQVFVLVILAMSSDIIHPT